MGAFLILAGTGKELVVQSFDAGDLFVIERLKLLFTGSLR